MIDTYNLVLDVKNYFRKNVRFLLLINAIVLIFVVLATVSACNCDVLQIKEGCTDTFVAYLENGNNWHLWKFFLSSLLVIAALVACRINKILTKLSVLLVGFRLYFIVRSALVAILCYGIKIFVPCLLICVAESLCSFVLEAFYGYNIHDCDNRQLLEACKSEEYRFWIIVMALVCAVFNLLSCLFCALASIFV